MVMCIEDFVSSSGADAAGDVPQSSCRDSVTWKSLYDRERIRAEAAEGLCEELRLQEVEERSRTNSLKAIFESNREKLSAARAEVREVRRTAKQSLALKQEVARPGQLLAEAGARKRSTVVSLRMENAGLKTAMKILKGRGGERQASFEQVVRAQEREEAAGAIEARPAVRHSWPRPALEEVEERLEVAEDACSCCVANGSHQDHRDQKRRIVRPRRGCDCPGSPSKVAARDYTKHRNDSARTFSRCIQSCRLLMKGGCTEPTLPDFLAAGPSTDRRSRKTWQECGTLCSVQWSFKTSTTAWESPTEQLPIFVTAHPLVPA